MSLFKNSEMTILKDREDIREYLDMLKPKNIKLILSINRSPFESEPESGTIDEFYLNYILNNSNLLEHFAMIHTTNSTNERLEKGKLENNVSPVEDDTIKKIWAQIAYRMEFIDERKIPFSFHFGKELVNLTQKLPHLPYSIYEDLTLTDVLEFTKKGYINYQRCTNLIRDNKLERQVFLSA